MGCWPIAPTGGGSRIWGIRLPGAVEFTRALAARAEVVIHSALLAAADPSSAAGRKAEARLRDWLDQHEAISAVAPDAVILQEVRRFNGRVADPLLEGLADGGLGEQVLSPVVGRENGILIASRWPFQATPLAQAPGQPVHMLLRHPHLRLHPPVSGPAATGLGGCMAGAARPGSSAGSAPDAATASATTTPW